MQSLSDLPDDSLRLVCFWLNGFDLFSFWMGSDLQLRNRLLDRVITEFNVEYHNPATYRWPGNFLKQIQRLSRLSLIVDTSMIHLPIHDIELFSIPTLKYLVLFFKNAHQVMRDKSLEALQGNDSPINPITYINLDKLFPNLEHFKIGKGSSERNLCLDFLACLPRNLKSLTIPDNYFEAPTEPNTLVNVDTLTEVLPRSLTQLEIYFMPRQQNFSFLDFSKLPPQLTSLCTNSHLSEDCYKNIPKSLEHMEIYSGEHDADRLCPFLPTGLRTLTLCGKNVIPRSEPFLHLTNLQKLSFNEPWSVKLNLITKYLPKLQIFSGSCLDLSELRSGDIISQIKVLELHDLEKITAEAIAGMPQTITQLSISRSHDDKEFCFFSVLPRNLKLLETNLKINEKLSSLPQTLTKLTLTYQDDIENSYIDQLPPQLEYLEFDGNAPQQIFTLLPSTLKELIITCSIPVDDAIIRTLPRGLKKLELRTPDDITDESAGHFPPNLEFLHLHENTNLTDQAISKLPRTLTVLKFLRNSNLTNQCIQYLPRKLVYLNLARCRQITSKIYKDLPPYLGWLYVGSWESRNTETEDLPKYLVSFNTNM